MRSDLCTAAGAQVMHEVLVELEFSSERARMSVVARAPGACPPADGAPQRRGKEMEGAAPAPPVALAAAQSAAMPRISSIDAGQSAALLSIMRREGEDAGVDAGTFPIR